MKTTFLLLFIFFSGTISAKFYKVYHYYFRDQVTGETIRFVNAKGYIAYWLPLRNNRGNKTDFNEELQYVGDDNFYNGFNFSDFSSGEVGIKWEFTFSYDGYESVTVTETISATKDGWFSDNWNVPAVIKTIYMKPIPKKIEQALQEEIKTEPLVQDNKDAEIKLIRADQLAKELSLKESDIITLIKTGKLKAKLIGNKYFIKREDWNSFLNDK